MALMEGTVKQPYLIIALTFSAHQLVVSLHVIDEFFASCCKVLRRGQHFGTLGVRAAGFALAGPAAGFVNGNLLDGAVVAVEKPGCKGGLQGQKRNLSIHTKETNKLEAGTRRGKASRRNRQRVILPGNSYRTERMLPTTRPRREDTGHTSQ